MTALLARHFMDSNITFLNPAMKLSMARDLLVKKKISGAPVISESGKLLGVLSQTDIVRLMLPEPLSAELEGDFFRIGLTPRSNEWQDLSSKFEKLTVGDVMSCELFTVTPTDTIIHVAERMQKFRIHRVIVKDGENVVGIVSTFDLLKVFLSVQNQSSSQQK